MQNLEYFQECTTQEEVKTRYRELAKQYHPDFIGDTPENTRRMQDINKEYAFANNLKVRQEKPDWSEDQYTRAANVAQNIKDAILAALNIDHDKMIIEVCGLWVWIHGLTGSADDKPARDQLKAAGYKFASEKKKWYYPGIDSMGRGTFTMGQIRTHYGSQRVNADDEKKKPTSKPQPALA